MKESHLSTNMAHSQSCCSSYPTPKMLSHKFIHGRYHQKHLRGYSRFRCVLLDHIATRLAVSSSLIGSSPNIIAAAVSSGSGSLHGAVTSTITQVAVTAVAIASGACLSTKVDFLWPKLHDDHPGLIFFRLSSLLFLWLYITVRLGVLNFVNECTDM